MAPFDLAQPRTLQEAFALLDAEGARPLSGGTALMLMMKAGVLRLQRLVSLRNLGLDRIEAHGTLRIGAMTTLSTLERSPEVRNGWLHSLLGQRQSVLAEKDGTGHAPNFARLAVPQGTVPGTVVELTPTAIEAGLLQ